MFGLVLVKRARFALVAAMLLGALSADDQAQVEAKRLKPDNGHEHNMSEVFWRKQGYEKLSEVQFKKLVMLDDRMIATRIAKQSYVEMTWKKEQPDWNAQEKT